MNTDAVVYATSGYTSSDVWDSYRQQIDSIRDSLVVIWLGTNKGLTNTVLIDCAGDDIRLYGTNTTGDYGRIIKTLTDNGNKVVLAHIVGSVENGILVATNDTISALAIRFNCKVIELNQTERIMLRDKEYHTSEDGTFDYIHFSSMGYSYVADLFYEKMNSLALDDPQWFGLN